MKKLSVYLIVTLLLVGGFSAIPTYAEETETITSTEVEIVKVIEETALETELVTESEDEISLQSSIELIECTQVYPTTTVSGGNATLTLPEGACPLEVTFASYSHTGTIHPLEDQVLVDHITNTYGPGTHNIGSLNLSCNWQTDLYSGEVQSELLPPPYEDGTPHGLTTGTVLYDYDYVENQVCDPAPEDMVLTVIKNVVGGTATSGEFMIQVSGGEATPSAFSGNASGTTVSINASSTYSVTETPVPGYSVSYSSDCSGVSINQYHPKTCVVTNTFVSNPSQMGDMILTVVKNVVGGTATSGAFTIQVSGGEATPSAFAGNASGTMVSINASSTYSVTELPVSGYTVSYSSDCFGVSINQYHPKTCIVTNTYISHPSQVGNIVVVKNVINDNGGTKQVVDFPLKVGTTTVSSGATTTFAFGTYTVSETYDSSLYAQSFSGDCDSNGSLTLNSTTTKICVITNNDIAPSIIDDDDNDGGSSRNRSRSRTTVRGISTEAEPVVTPQVLGVQYEIMPGLPSTGLGPISIDVEGSNNVAIVIFGLLSIVSLNILAIYATKRRSL